MIDDLEAARYARINDSSETTVAGCVKFASADILKDPSIEGVIICAVNDKGEAKYYTGGQAVALRFNAIGLLEATKLNIWESDGIE